MLSGSCYPFLAGLKPGHYGSHLFRGVAERFDFYVHARGQVELHQRVYRVRRGLENVDLALLRTQHGPAVDCGRQRNRAGNIGAGALCGFHNFPRRLVQDAVIVSLEADANFISLSHSVTR